MKSLFISSLLFCSLISESQVLISRGFEDSLHTKEQSYIGTLFKSFNEKDVTGKYFTNKDFKGKITLVNFWFEACHPCVAEFDVLNKIFDSLSTNKDFQFISFTFDHTNSVAESIRKYHLHFPVISISKEECYNLNCSSGFPISMIIDREGKIAFIKSGGDLDMEQATVDVNRTLLPKIIELLNN
jgi:cytochrome oxidase Cu insertion factor (SCO1/SenC/PrrC family)